VSIFNEDELAYLQESRLGRLATIGADGMPHVVPLGWTYNPELDTIDIGGRDLPNTKKFRNVRRDSRVAIVIDDVLPPWRPRSVMVQGRGEALEDARAAEGSPIGAIIRIRPTRVISRGLHDSQ
jgi:pyridoxamine 5'-phosphate oxidase family protein